MKARDITGQKFASLTAVRMFDDRRWLFRCDCGKEMPMQKTDVIHARIKTCVDCGRAVQGQKIIKHGQSRGSEYQTYHVAMQRCNNPKDANYDSYGGRGIRFLFTSYEQFIAVLGPRPEGLVLDRIDNDGHYEPTNVRWTTHLTSTLNRRPRQPKTNDCHPDKPYFAKRMCEPCYYAWRHKARKLRKTA